ncbi:immobilization antigen isoform, putative [Ichthyophthirius multifiliis]|uniref:Immobilization antigen isoform, putative n=1 Tax=Ichthyophthirius multifiliis TaxID=5932 RepID=G0QT84_ICHMU|nr:immobilization antigen isoform, putative [Ichthyophthirius multifiliis]EGR31568.1 immobilization antigen isoform, putative [Ichthyophthirius multifiliis]|eukprot:XP_004035054.1 immobilization antigen isoform, putative [Ichthyophthirius multifiliis]
MILKQIFNLFNYLITQLCLLGTETNVAGEKDHQRNPANCVNFKPDYYFNGDNFIPGVSECQQCPIPLKIAAQQANAGGIAKLALQCEINCPAGTQTEHGETVYVAQKEECNFCKAGFYFQSDIFTFSAGVHRCEQCGIKKAGGSKATLGVNASIEQQCNINCPTGTITDTGATIYLSHQSECVNCNINFYLESHYFLAGESTCKPCPVKKSFGARHTLDQNAKIEVQCDVECPNGTVIYDGKTNNFKNEKSECIKCAANFNNVKQEEWVAGTDICFPCSNILIQGAQANYHSVATQATICRGTFSQFLTFSLLFICLYFL